MERAGAHRSRIASASAIQAHRPGELAAVGDRERRLEPIGEPGLLVLVDAEQSERLGELVQVIGPGRDQRGDPAGGEHACDLVSVPRGEHVEDGSGRAVPKRQRPPDVAGDGREPGMGASRAAQSRLGDIEREAARPGPRLENAREVPAGAGAEVDHAGGRAAGRLTRRFRERFGQRVEVPGGQEALPGGHHLGGVP
jgi:hypothetical protein